MSFFHRLMVLLIVFSLIAYFGAIQATQINLPGTWILADYLVLAEQTRPAYIVEREEEKSQKNKRKGNLELRGMFPEMSDSSPVSLNSLREFNR